MHFCQGFWNKLESCLDRGNTSAAYQMKVTFSAQVGSPSLCLLQPGLCPTHSLCTLLVPTASLMVSISMDISEVTMVFSLTPQHRLIGLQAQANTFRVLGWVAEEWHVPQDQLLNRLGEQM